MMLLAIRAAVISAASSSSSQAIKDMSLNCYDKFIQIDLEVEKQIGPGREDLIGPKPYWINLGYLEKEGAEFKSFGLRPSFNVDALTIVSN